MNPLMEMKLCFVILVFLTVIDSHEPPPHSSPAHGAPPTNPPAFQPSPWPPSSPGGGERKLKSASTSTADDWYPWFSSREERQKWRGNDPIPRRFLYGVTYYPWRRSKNCSEVSEADVRKDFAFISSIARNVQIFDLYCNLTPIIVDLAKREDLGLLLGMSSITDDAEFQRQKVILESLVRNANLSRVLGITVGRTSQLSGPHPDTILQKLHEITALVRAGAPHIPVSMIRDAPKNDFQAPESLKVVSSYAPFNDSKKPWPEDFFQFFSSWLEDYKKKDQTTRNTGTPYYTEFGYPIELHATHEYGESFPMHGHGGPPGPPPVIMMMLEKLACLQEPGGPREPPWKRPMPEPYKPSPKLPDIRYFYHSAFDMPFEYGYNDTRASWGLADSDTRELKPLLRMELSKKAMHGGFPSFKCSDLFYDMMHDEGKSKDELKYQWAGIGASLGLAGLALTALICIMWRRRRVRKAEALKMKMLEEQLEESRSNNNAYVRTLASYMSRNTDSYVDLISKADYENLTALVGQEWRIEETAIRFEEIIGEGHFGIVQRGTLTRGDETVVVAVKRLHVGAKNIRQFLSEGMLMQKFQHPNILPLVGISFTSYYLPMIVTPFMQKGDLLSFVKDGDNRLTVRQLLKFGLEIAEGMRYMHNMKLIHRDLAARNCMLDDSLTVKIADFGLCRDVSDSDSYQTARASDIPIRWMPPETIEKLEWTNKSDVWSYGIVLWELFTRGKQPYTRVPLVELRAFLRSGGRLQKPEGCPDLIYDLMKNCWHGQAEQRPAFTQLCESIPALVQALEGEQILDLPDYYNTLTVMEMSQQPASS